MPDVADLPPSLGPLAAIAAMAVATYACRLAGFLIMSRLPPNPFVERALAALPGAIIASTVVPIALRGGWPAIAAVSVGIAVMAVTRREIVGLLAGLATAILWRALI